MRLHCAFLPSFFAYFRKKVAEFGKSLYICNLNHSIAINLPPVTRRQAVQSWIRVISRDQELTIIYYIKKNSVI